MDASPGCDLANNSLCSGAISDPPAGRWRCGVGSIFVIELGYPIFTATTTAFLFTTGTFYVTKSLYKNFSKPRSEWDWYVPLLLVIFLITGASLIVLRLANRGTDSTSLPIDVASALILAFVTLLPGWPAAKYDDQLSKTRELDRTAQTLRMEYHKIQLRVAALREGIDAKSPEDFRLIDKREQLKAIIEQRQRELSDGRQSS